MLYLKFEDYSKIQGFHLCVSDCWHQIEEETPEHSHSNFYELVIVKDGSALHVLNGRQHPISSGSIFLITPDERHYYTRLNNLHIYNFLFRADFCSFCYSDLNCFPGFQMLFQKMNNPKQQEAETISRLTIDIDIFPKILQYAEELKKFSITHEHGYRTAMLAIFLQMLYLLAQNIKSDELSTFYYATKINMIIQFMNNHLSDDISLNSLAHQAGMSISSFQHNFKKIIGISPGNYLLRQRLYAVRDLLELGNYSIMEIAIRCGFYDGNYLTRQFKKHFGITPSEYRKMTSFTIKHASSGS